MTERHGGDTCESALPAALTHRDVGLNLPHHPAPPHPASRCAALLLHVDPAAYTWARPLRGVASRPTSTCPSRNTVNSRVSLPT